MAKIVYNACYGGFSLSAEAARRGKELSQEPHWKAVDPQWGSYRGPRHDPVLVQVVEELGDKASGRFAKLEIRDIPSGSRYRIDEYDGIESVMTPDDDEWEIAP